MTWGRTRGLEEGRGRQTHEGHAVVVNVHLGRQEGRHGERGGLGTGGNPHYCGSGACAEDGEAMARRVVVLARW
jgi:hypothetical protein